MCKNIFPLTIWMKKLWRRIAEILNIYSYVFNFLPYQPCTDFFTLMIYYYVWHQQLPYVRTSTFPALFFAPTVARSLWRRRPPCLLAACLLASSLPLQRWTVHFAVTKQTGGGGRGGGERNGFPSIYLHASMHTCAECPRLTGADLLLSEKVSTAKSL